MPDIVTSPSPQPAHEPAPAGDRSNRRFRRATALGLTAGLLGGGAAGLFVAVPSLSSAATDTTIEAETGTDETDTDTDTGARPVLTERLRERLQSLVDDGTISADQADVVATHLADSLPVRAERLGRGELATVVATALGIEVDELRAALVGGRSVADVATDEGVDLQVVIDAIVADAEVRLDARVADGTLTEAKAANRLAELTERVTDRLNEGGGLGGLGGPDGAGRRGDGRWHRGSESEGAAATDA